MSYNVPITTSGKLLAAPKTDATTAIELTSSTGSPVLYVDTTNSQIGINVSTPSAPLEVNGEARAAGFVSLNNTGIDIYQTIGYTGNDQIHLDIDGSASFLNGELTLDSSLGLFLGKKNYVTFQGDIGDSVAISAPHSVSNSYTLYLPSATPSANKVLAVSGQDGDGSGAWDLTWSNTATPGGATGSVQFNSSGSFTGDATHFFWDSTNHRLGIGTSTPGVSLDVSGGNINTSGNFTSSGSAEIDAGYTTLTNTTLKFFPNTNSTSAIQFRDANQINTILTIDTTNLEVGIGTTSPNSSAVLDLTSTTKGFLPPRMTTTQRNAISFPATGLIIYNTTDNQWEGNSGTSVSPNWVILG